MVVEGFGASGLYRRNRRTWVLHEGLIYVVPVFALVAVLLGSYESLRSNLSPAHPLTILAALLAFVVLATTLTVRRRRRPSMSEQDRISPFFGVDYVFLELLMLAIIAGIVSAAQWRGDISWSMTILLVHLVLVAVLFLVAPSTSFAHAVVVPVLVAIVRLNQAYAASRPTPATPIGANGAGPDRAPSLSETVLGGLDSDLRIAVLNTVRTLE